MACALEYLVNAGTYNTLVELVEAASESAAIARKRSPLTTSNNPLRLHIIHVRPIERGILDNFVFWAVLCYQPHAPVDVHTADCSTSPHCYISCRVLR